MFDVAQLSSVELPLIFFVLYYRAVNEPLPNSGPSSAHDSPSLTRTDSSQRLSGTHKDSGPIRFAVRSLGWVRIAEEDLTPERSSRAVNKCIVDLSLGRNDINDVVGRWGDVCI